MEFMVKDAELDDKPIEDDPDKDDPDKDDPDKDDPKKNDPDDDPLKILQTQVTKLEGDKRNLNTALHQARQEKKQKKGDTDAGEQLTNDQIEELIREHADDPKVMTNIIGYIAEQSAKNQITVGDIAQLKKETEPTTWLYPH
jgi:hypothetical protein